MINKHIELLCSEDPHLIENYDSAISDTTQVWHCHHRLETEKNLSTKELMSMNMYYHRPASELIFLTPFEHNSLHRKGKLASLETKKKMSEVQKGKNNGFYGRKHTEETKKKIGESHKGNKYRLGKTFSEETKKKMSESHKGQKPWHAGKTNVYSDEARKKMSESHKGKYSDLVWINNGINNKRIHKNIVDTYLQNGYKRGRISVK